MLHPKTIIAICAIIAITTVAYFSVKRAHWQQKEPVAKQQTTEKGHLHGNEGHDETHETPDEQEKTVSEKPANTDTKQVRPTEWHPELVFKAGDGKEIDLNYRPLTEEEQAEYERLKATENPEHYRNFEAGIRIVAIGNIKEKHRPEVTKRIGDDLEAGRISIQEARKQIREFYEFFAD